MTTKSDSSVLPGKSKAAKKTKPERRPRLGLRLIESAEQMLAHVRGEIKLESYTLPGPVDVKAIRRKVGMSQAEFAAAFALNRRTLQQWEQGKAAPDGAVRAYLTVIGRNSSAVVEALQR